MAKDYSTIETFAQLDAEEDRMVFSSIRILPPRGFLLAVLGGILGMFLLGSRGAAVMLAIPGLILFAYDDRRWWREFYLKEEAWELRCDELWEIHRAACATGNYCSAHRVTHEHGPGE